MDGKVGMPLRAQVHSSLGRSSKVIKDREAIEVIVEVPGTGRLVLCVASGGRYSLRSHPEGRSEAVGRNLLAVGVLGTDGIEAV